MENEVREPAVAYGKSVFTEAEYLYWLLLRPYISAFRINAGKHREPEAYKSLQDLLHLNAAAATLPLQEIYEGV